MPSAPLGSAIKALTGKIRHAGDSRIRPGKRRRRRRAGRRGMGIADGRRASGDKWAPSPRVLSRKMSALHRDRVMTESLVTVGARTVSETEVSMDAPTRSVARALTLAAVSAGPRRRSIR